MPDILLFMHEDTNICVNFMSKIVKLGLVFQELYHYYCIMLSLVGQAWNFWYCIIISAFADVNILYATRFLYCSIFCISCWGDLSIYILLMFCTEIWSPAIYFLMQTVTSRFVTLGSQEPPQRQISWRSMLWPDGIVLLNYCSTAQSILQQLICGRLAVY